MRLSGPGRGICRDGPGRDGTLGGAVDFSTISLTSILLASCARCGRPTYGLHVSQPVGTLSITSRYRGDVSIDRNTFGPERRAASHICASVIRSLLSIDTSNHDGTGGIQGDAHPETSSRRSRLVGQARRSSPRRCHCPSLACRQFAIIGKRFSWRVLPAPCVYLQGLSVYQQGHTIYPRTAYALEHSVTKPRNGYARGQRTCCVASSGHQSAQVVRILYVCWQLHHQMLMDAAKLPANEKRRFGKIVLRHVPKTYTRADVFDRLLAAGVIHTSTHSIRDGQLDVHSSMVRMLTSQSYFLRRLVHASTR